MTGQRYTPEGLPIISLATAEVWLRDFLAKVSQGVDMTGEMERNMVNDNPRINDIIDTCLNAKGLERMDNFYLGFLVVYDLLRRQAEANRLEDI